MAQKDWEEVIGIIEDKSPGLFKKFLISEQSFLPNETFPNPFNEEHSNFSASDLGKGKPGQWIPVYYTKDIPEYFRENSVVPVRAGPAEFFFYKGEVFFDLKSVDFEKIDTDRINPIESYIPVTLKAKFQRNENAYLNKAIALGYINHFVDDVGLAVFEHEIETKTHKRLLYGQFGKIKITNPLQFKTSKGSKTLHPGFQFEIDLVLENRDEIIIFEAKTGSKPFDNFSILQLYYPLIYLRSIIDEPKPIRTIFMDITATEKKEAYRLLEVRFNEDLFDELEVLSACKYVK
ncbi:hypothetical protein [Sulfurovum sp.]|uniref:DUF6997 domain-containing protein n=1 Tax=Sulfurovum sp. TaxID=1969726 RepID=UPI0025D7C22B|nr:hypothetical protein [Sulfurovum sp.]